MKRVLIVSHPAVLDVNQLPYAALADHGWEAWLVVPARWRHEYAAGSIAPTVLPDLAPRRSLRRVALPGRPQRHFYVSALSSLLRQLRPDVAFVEAEPTSLSALQWSRALTNQGIPFAVQAAENLPRTYPWPARVARAYTLKHASLVAARSPAAGRIVRHHAPQLATPLIPHHIPPWKPPPRDHGARPFTVGYAGRLVPQKGLDHLLEAVSRIPGTRARFVGNGPLLEHFERQVAEGFPLEIVTDVDHASMASAYASFDVLVLPSLTTPTWTEQFGRVLVEALWCGVPVVGSSSGEIPWVISTTRGGEVFREGDVAQLQSILERFKASPELRRDMAARGRQAVERLFSVEAVTCTLAEAFDRMRKSETAMADLSRASRRVRTKRLAA